MTRALFLASIIRGQSAKCWFRCPDYAEKRRTDTPSDLLSLSVTDTVTVRRGSEETAVGTLAISQL